MLPQVTDTAELDKIWEVWDQGNSFGLGPALSNTKFPASLSMCSPKRFAKISSVEKEYLKSVIRVVLDGWPDDRAATYGDVFHTLQIQYHIRRGFKSMRRLIVEVAETLNKRVTNRAPKKIDFTKEKIRAFIEKHPHLGAKKIRARLPTEEKLSLSTIHRIVMEVRKKNEQLGIACPKMKQRHPK